MTSISEWVEVSVVINKTYVVECLGDEPLKSALDTVKTRLDNECIEIISARKIPNVDDNEELAVGREVLRW